MKPAPGQAIPFIEYEEDYDSGKILFSLNPLAIAILQELKEKKISVVSFVGPAKSEKSTLANHLLGRKDGFFTESSSSVQRGIWMWSQPVKFREESTHETLILSCQGLGVQSTDRNMDAKLLTICALFSSTLVYSASGEIDEDLLEYLNGITKIPDCIDLAINETAKGNFSSFVASLFWVVDELYHGTKGSTEHLEEALTNTSLGENNANIKATIKTLFAARKGCYYESKNSEMYIEELLDNVHPKLIYSKPITCSMLLNLSFDYLDGLNNETPISVYSVIDRASFSETRKVCDDLMIEYHEEADEIFNPDRMPFDEEQMRKDYRTLSTAILNKFETITKDFAETSQLLELRFEMQDKFEKDFEEVLKNNKELSQNLCKRIISEFITDFDTQSYSSLSEMPESLIQEQKEKFMFFYENYKEFAKGASKYEIFSDIMPNCLFDFIDKFHSNYKRLMSNELSQVTLAYQELKASEEISKKTVVDNFDTLINSQRDKEELKNSYDKNEREHNLYKKLKEQEISSLNETISELEKRLNKKKSKKSKLKEEKSELKEKYDTLERKVSELLISESRLKDEIQFMKSNPTLISSSSSPIKDNSTLVMSLRQEIDGLKKLLQQAIQDSRGIRDSQTQIIDKEAEIAQTKEEFSKRLDENFKKIQQMKSEHSKEKEALKKERDHLFNENTTLKIELSSKTDALQKKEQEFLNIKNDYAITKADYEVKLRDYKVSVEVTFIFKKQIEENLLKIQELEYSVAELKAKILRFENLRTDLIFAARESIKKAQRNKHHLKQAIDGLDLASATEFKDMLQEFKITPD